MPQDASKRPPRPSKIDFSSQHGLLKPQQTNEIYWKNNDSEPLHEFNIRSLLYQTLMPTWLHFGVKFPPRRLLDAFKTPLDAPAWCPRGPRSHPRGAQDAPRTAQELPWRRRHGTEEAAHRCLGAKTRHKAAPDSLQTSTWELFGWIFRKVLEGF